MNLRNIESFYWVVTLQSITKAAEKFSITQPAMSGRLASLEEELGITLLSRINKRFELTKEGRYLFEHAQKFIDLQNQLIEALAPRTGVSKTLRVGAIEAVMQTWLFKWLIEAKTNFPRVKIELAVDTTPALIERLQSSQLDIVYTSQPAAETHNISSRRLPPMHMAIVTKRVIPDKLSKLTLEQLASFDISTFYKGSHAYESLVKLFKEHGVKPKAIHEISSISAIGKIVNSGMGVAFLPLHSIELEIERGLFSVLETTVNFSPMPVYVSYRETGPFASMKCLINRAVEASGVAAEFKK